MFGFSISSSPRNIFCLFLVANLLSPSGNVNANEIEKGNVSRPNILFAIADDWGWPHAGAYGDPVVKTPAFDRIAKEGILFQHAYVASPSCTPSRSAILTGQWHWRLKAGANLHCIFPDQFKTYPEILKKNGYYTGFCSKGWGPGRTETKGRTLAGKRYKNFKHFLKSRNQAQAAIPKKPFCFWLGSLDPHRPYKEGSGAASGMDIEKIKLPGCFPDTPVVRNDVADYYVEVQRFDRDVSEAIAALEAIGELDNTIIVMTGDHGMPFPRGKCNLYDTGVRVPLAIRWPEKIKADRVIDDFVSLTDLAPTFLEVAGIGAFKNNTGLKEMTGRSLTNIFYSKYSGQVDHLRSFVLTGRERHCVVQERPDTGGYPSRSIRTRNFLYIRNFTPNRWPSGTPDYKIAQTPGSWYGDCDNGPTKTYMIQNRELDPAHRNLFELSFAKRPAEELYDLINDPDQLKNVASESRYRKFKSILANQLMSELKKTKDPRVTGGGDQFDKYPYLGGAPKHPDWKKTGK